MRNSINLRIVVPKKMNKPKNEEKLLKLFQIKTKVQEATTIDRQT